MRRVVIKLLITFVPHGVLARLFPNATWLGASIRKFITIEDSIAGKPIRMFLREDSMMERLFLNHGLYGDWEKESLKIWATLSKHAGTIIDIGANTGVFSLVAQNNNPSAMVIAIEPVGVNFEVLSKNILENHLSIHAENVALSNVEGVAKMYMLKDRLNYMTSVNDNLYTAFPHIQGNSEIVEIEVPIKPFSWVMTACGLSALDLVKIDVEGHELAVVRSMMPFIEKLKPVILIEIIGNETAQGLERMFGPLGYLYVCIDELQRSRVVDKLWDNDRHNFLLCHASTIAYLRDKELVA